MPKTLTPVNAFPTSIPNFPMAGNNEPVAIGPLENAIQAVLNRTENLHVRLLDGETNGVKRIRRFASLAALSAATGFSDGDVADVEGYGRYRLYDPSALTADGLWILTAAGGSGRWVHILNSMRGANNGLATLTSGGRLAQNPQDGSIVTAHIANSAVTTPKLADFSVSTPKLADGAVNPAKLAAGAAIANIGYTPVNKAGDTMAGALALPNLMIAGSTGSVPLGGKQLVVIAPGTAQYAYICTLPVSSPGTWDRVLVEIFGAVFGGYGDSNMLDYIQAIFTNREGFNARLKRSVVLGNTALTRIQAYWQGDGSVQLWLRCDGSSYLAFNIQARHIGATHSGTTNNPTAYIPIGDLTASTPPGTVIWDSSTATPNWSVEMGEIRGRYNHAERWSVNAFLGGSAPITLAPNDSRILCRHQVFVPSGKTLYLRRLRWAMISWSLRARVSSTYVFNTSSSTGDESANFALTPTGSNILHDVFIEIINPTQSNINISVSDSIWCELEIR